MTSRERLLTALENKKPDRLPATTHTLQDYYMNTYEPGKSFADFFTDHGLDRVHWIYPFSPDPSAGQYFADEPSCGYSGIVTDSWRISKIQIDDPQYMSWRYRIETPKGELSMIIQANEYTRWVTEHLVKEPKDIELIAEYAPHSICDRQLAERELAALGTDGIVRSHIPGFDIYGQPGCWQDAAVLVGIQKLIMATFDDPVWVRELLSILKERKLSYIRSAKECKVDLWELGGGDASTTVISPSIFNEFVVPYDEPLVAAAHESGMKITYHTCGGMMPILEDIRDMRPDAMETFTPVGMGADVDLSQAHERIGADVCFIGGFDQGGYFLGSTYERTKNEVQRCFEAAGRDGGFIISPSDHFFDAEPELIDAFADGARACLYE